MKKLITLSALAFGVGTASAQLLIGLPVPSLVYSYSDFQIVSYRGSVYYWTHTYFYGGPACCAYNSTYESWSPNGSHAGPVTTHGTFEVKTANQSFAYSSTVDSAVMAYSGGSSYNMISYSPFSGAGRYGWLMEQGNDLRTDDLYLGSPYEQSRWLPFFGTTTFWSGKNQALMESSGIIL